MECIVMPFKNMTEAEAERFMLGNVHPMREIAAGQVGDRTVLDLGCGRGIKVKALYTSGQYLGIDYSQELIKIARRDNPGYHFQTYDILDFIETFPKGDIQVGVMVSVLEHVSSLEEAQDIYNEAKRVCKTLLVGWHCPPHYPETSILKVQAELDSPMNQNHYEEGTFHGAIRVIKVKAGELWVVRS